MNPSAPPGQALAERRNFAATVKDRKFHSKSDLYSQPSVGDMFSNLTASYDPIFWPVHVNVDRLWWEWQTRNPTGVPYDLDSVLSPWSYTIRDMLEISRFGYEYVRCSFFIPVGIEAPIARFVSAPIKIDPKAKDFKKAEIRMHWVPQLVRSCFIRAFLNDPRADASTPVREIRTMRAISRSSAMAIVTAARAIASCHRRARGRSTSARAVTIRRATTASTSRPLLIVCCKPAMNCRSRCW